MPVVVILETVPPPRRCPAEVSIGGLDQSGLGIGAVRLVEDVQRAQRACRGDS